jgi:hypothetical protein
MLDSRLKRAAEILAIMKYPLLAGEFTQIRSPQLANLDSRKVIVLDLITALLFLGDWYHQSDACKLLWFLIPLDINEPYRSEELKSESIWSRARRPKTSLIQFLYLLQHRRRRT